MWLIKYIVFNRIVKQKQLMLRWRNSNLCPMIQERLELSKKAADKCLAVWNGDPNLSIFEVSRDEDEYVVKLDAGTCACRRWEQEEFLNNLSMSVIGKSNFISSVNVYLNLITL